MLDRTPRLFASLLLILPLLGGGESDSRAAEVARLRRHYAAVDAALSTSAPAGLTEEQLRRRADALAQLRAYAARGEFPDGPEKIPGRLVPIFVDEQGTHCAVAHLLQQTGQEPLVREVKAARNTAWVAELADDARLLAWLDANGLTPEDAARIQGPSEGFAPQIVGPRDPTPNPYNGPADAGQGRTGPAAPSAPVTPGGAAPARGGSVPGAITTPALASLPPAWRYWWEYHKLDFLSARLKPAAPRDGETTTALSATAADRDAIVPALADKDPMVRSMACLAAGSLLRADAVAHLRPALEDSSASVRLAAILGLGATGSQAAIPLLLHLAWDGHPDGPGHSAVAAQARPFALVALGIGRRLGMRGTIDPIVKAILESPGLPAAHRDAMRGAALVYLRLSPTPLLVPFAESIARDANEAVDVRARALEALGAAGDREALLAILACVDDPKAGVREAALLALGQHSDPLAERALLRALDGESGENARGYALISLGRHGSTEARARLVAALTTGESRLKPWAALGLGVALREHRDEAALKALREFTGSRNADHRSSGRIALGIARDANSGDVLKEAIGRRGFDADRGEWALALALSGAPASHESIAAEIGSERAVGARASFAVALGSFGVPADADALLSTAADIRQEADLLPLTVGARLHAAPELRASLEKAAAAPGAARLTRAIAQAARIPASQAPRVLWLQEVWRNVSLETFSPWMGELLKFPI